MGVGGRAYVLRQRLHRRKRKWGDAYSVGSCNGACWLSQRGGAPPLWSGAKRQEGKERRGEGWRRRTYRPEGVDTLSIVVAIDNSLENSIKRFRRLFALENPRLCVTRSIPPPPMFLITIGYAGNSLDFLDMYLIWLRGNGFWFVDICSILRGRYVKVLKIRCHVRFYPNRRRILMLLTRSSVLPRINT